MMNIVKEIFPMPQKLQGPSRQGVMAAHSRAGTSGCPDSILFGLSMLRHEGVEQ
jgi:hypothetical protein